MKVIQDNVSMTLTPLLNSYSPQGNLVCLTVSAPASFSVLTGTPTSFTPARKTSLFVMSTRQPRNDLISVQRSTSHPLHLLFCAQTTRGGRAPAAPITGNSAEHNVYFMRH